MRQPQRSGHALIGHERRQGASNGTKIYGVRSYALREDRQRDRIIVGDKLVDVEHARLVC